MTAVAKRKIAESWREAVSRRAGLDRCERCVSAFERGVAAGMTEAEAAYRTLEAEGLLWNADHLGDVARPFPFSTAG